MSCYFGKVTTGTYNFVSVILRFAPDGTTTAGLPPCAFRVVILAKTQFFEQVKNNSTSQLINGIFKLLQNLLKCFSGTTNFAFVNESLSSGAFLQYLFCI